MYNVYETFSIKAIFVSFIFDRINIPNTEKSQAYAYALFKMALRIIEEEKNFIAPNTIP